MKAVNGLTRNINFKINIVLSMIKTNEKDVRRY